MAKQTKYNKSRLIIQWSVLLLLAYMVIRLITDKNYFGDVEAYCPFGGVQALGSYLINQTLTCSMTSAQIVMGIILAIGVFLFSKLFCGYICPLGTISEWLGKLGSKLKVHYTIKGIMDRILRSLKYILLFITFYYTLDSSELFCRKWDPFYAIFSGFSSDVNIWMGVLSIFIVVAGSVVIRQFWCKYLCPLAALSNIFTYLILFVVIMGAYTGGVYFGLEISYVWPLLLITILAFIIEAYKLEGIFFPLLRITRNDDKCTHCKLCDKACPQAITISTGNTKIKHIDCNLCTACVTVCPHTGALGINKRKLNGLPALLTIALVSLGLFLGTKWEIPTVDERWGNSEQLEEAQIFERSGLKNIKCYGSSMGFVTKMKEIDGVLGVATFTSSKSVKVYYNENIISEEELAKAIFSPIRNIFIGKDLHGEVIHITEFGIQKFLDENDKFYLTKLFEQTEGIVGFETEGSEPVQVRVFYDSLIIPSNEIGKLIEKEEFSYSAGGNIYTEELSFKLEYIKPVNQNLTYVELKQSFFKPYYESFYTIEDSLNLAYYEIAMPNILLPEEYNMLPYLCSHITLDRGIKSFETVFTEEPVARILVDTSSTNADAIFNLLTRDSLEVIYADGSEENIYNSFVFDKPGKFSSVSNKGSD